MFKESTPYDIPPRLGHNTSHHPNTINPTSTITTPTKTNHNPPEK